jgi:hypothetical protein
MLVAYGDIPDELAKRMIRLGDAQELQDNRRNLGKAVGRVTRIESLSKRVVFDILLALC